MALVIPFKFSNKSVARLPDLDDNFEYIKSQIDPYVDNIIVNPEGSVTIPEGIEANVTGNLTGNLTGNVDGNVDGNLSGSVQFEGESPLLPNAKIASSEVGSIYAPGMIIQTVYRRIDDKATVNFAGGGSIGSFITQLDTNFTPKFANSLIHIQMCLSFEVHHDTVFRLYRNETPIGINVNDQNYWSGTWYTGYDVDNSTTPRTNHYFYMDSPGTTSQITYRLMIQSAGIGATTFFLNRTVSSPGAANHEVAISQIIIQEIKQ